VPQGDALRWDMMPLRGVWIRKLLLLDNEALTKIQCSRSPLASGNYHPASGRNRMPANRFLFKKNIDNQVFD
jgi:hypothetical protein